MSFPAEAGLGEIDDRGLFLVQDPDIRVRVLPLFSFDPERADDRPVGHGTTFRIDPWSRCLTAYHVMEDLFVADEGSTGAVLRSNLRLAALEVEGVGFGAVGLRTGAWRPLAGSYTLCRVETPPFQAPQLRNLTELVVLRIRSPNPNTYGTPYWPLDLRCWWPRIGERVQALGFAGLDAEDGSDERPISQYLYGSFGEITDVEPADGVRGRPWPMIRVAAEWPGGMSGGPVFNGAGHVIGVVSSGIVGGVGTGTFFSGWNMPDFSGWNMVERIMGSIDPDNPGRFLCHGIFDETGDLVLATQDAEEARRFAESRNLTERSVVSVDPIREGWIRLDRRW